MGAEAMGQVGRSGGLLVSIALVLCACDDESTAPVTNSGVAGGGASTSEGGAGAGNAAGGNGGQGGQPISEGKITITASALTDADGKQLIATVLTTDTSTQLGAICETISGSPGSASGVVSEADSTNICQLDSEVVFDPDTYKVSAGIYASGQPAPELCAATTVTVTGNVTVTLTDFSACN